MWATQFILSVECSGLGAMQVYSDHRIICSFMTCHIAMTDAWDTPGVGGSGYKSYIDPVANMTYREVGIICAQSVNLLESLGEVLAQLRGITHSVSLTYTRKDPSAEGAGVLLHAIAVVISPPLPLPTFRHNGARRMD